MSAIVASSARLLLECMDPTTLAGRILAHAEAVGLRPASIDRRRVRHGCYGWKRFGGWTLTFHDARGAVAAGATLPDVLGAIDGLATALRRRT